MSALIPAVAYLRDSSQAQADIGLSIPAQREEAQKYAKANGYEIIREYVDDGISGKYAEDRPEFLQMMHDAKLKHCPFEIVLVWAWSRFARNTYEALLYERDFERAGIKLVSITEPLIDGPEGKILKTVIHSFNEYFSAKLGKDTLRGSRQAVLQGHAPGGPAPLGLKKVFVANEKGVQYSKYAPDDEKKHIVQHIYELYSKEKFSIDRIVAQMQAEHPWKKWNPPGIWGILFWNQEAYLGNTVYNRKKYSEGIIGKTKPQSDWVIASNTHEPIISRDLADAANALRESRTRGFMLGQNRHNHIPQPFYGLIFCTACGAPMKMKNTRTGYYHACVNRTGWFGHPITDKSERCQNKYIPFEKLNKLLWEDLAKHISAPNLLSDLEKIAQQEYAESNTYQISVEKELQERISKLEKRKKNILEAIADGTIKGSDAKQIMDEITASLAKSNNELFQIRNKGFKGNVEFMERIKAIIDDPSMLKNSENIEAKAAIAFAFISRIEAGPESAFIKYRIPVPDSICEYRF